MPIDTLPAAVLLPDVTGPPPTNGTAVPQVITPLSEVERAALLRLTCSAIEADIAGRLASREPGWAAVAG